MPWKELIGMKNFPLEDQRYNVLVSFVSTIQCEKTKSTIYDAIQNNYSRSYNLTDDWSIVRRDRDYSLSVNKPQLDLTPNQYDNSFIWREYIQRKPEDDKRILDYWLTQVKYRTTVRIFSEIHKKIPSDSASQLLQTIKRNIYKDLDIVL